MRDKYLFSDAQDLATAVAGTGVVSANVFDMELDASGGNTILTNDQLEAVLNVQILATTNAGASGGMDVELRSSDNANLETSDKPHAKIHFTNTEIAAGTKKSIKVLVDLAQCFLGLFYMPITTDLTGATTVDAWLSPAPDGSSNDSIQKVPS